MACFLCFHIKNQNRIISSLSSNVPMMQSENVKPSLIYTLCAFFLTSLSFIWCKACVHHHNQNRRLTRFISPIVSLHKTNSRLKESFCLFPFALLVLLCSHGYEWVCSSCAQNTFIHVHKTKYTACILHVSQCQKTDSVHLKMAVSVVTVCLQFIIKLKPLFIVK